MKSPNPLARPFPIANLAQSEIQSVFRRAVSIGCINHLSPSIRHTQIPLTRLFSSVNRLQSLAYRLFKAPASTRPIYSITYLALDQSLTRNHRPSRAPLPASFSLCSIHRAYVIPIYTSQRSGKHSVDISFLAQMVI